MVLFLLLFFSMLGLAHKLHEVYRLVEGVGKAVLLPRYKYSCESLHINLVKLT